ncbi:DUF6817 domain-containing protein [Vibrio alginolyticus]|uniref:DUF6817 domain-containing protein n=1 Tax=Vibrio TaxID=662 RepID=UPI001BD66ED9|nr:MULTISPECIES: hypothetical protein [Vibrio]EII3281987.1 hypothetical protein [Vibrio alginolyticus]EIL2911183.1 hypothetical protein [Vibrio alginolyticus]EJX1246932.1 hypothetical protein [Vibrio alginolyticus]ELB2798400.1 hypothetical protein [Vibrio alginolyticus]ELB2831960.1 hypothetical protein [Vibrio alginolyticus]
MDKFEILQELGAGDFQHLNGSLEAHLKGTQEVLMNWGSSELLQVAGLFHAAYGTAGFDENMVSLSQRQEIARIIGSDEEALVYLYCSCDRDYVLPQFGKAPEIQFKDRFTGSTFKLDSAMVKLFCELTVANELELVFSSDEFKLKYGAELFELFQGMDSYLSAEAKKAYKSALSNFA